MGTYGHRRAEHRDICRIDFTVTRGVRLRLVRVLFVAELFCVGLIPHGLTVTAHAIARGGAPAALDSGAFSRPPRGA